jgi:hypothetical protein
MAWILGIAFLCIAAAWFALTVETTTRQGINYEVSEIRIPRYLKILNFLDRHFSYKWIVGRIIQGDADDYQKAKILLQWTADHIAEQPAQLDVVDDHVWHIIVRGYGKEDQMADVFATLSNYAGLRAFFWRCYGSPGSIPGHIYLAAVHFDGEWHLCDVYRRVAFINNEGRWATVAEVLAGVGRPESLQGVSAAKTVFNYQPYLHALKTLDIDDVQRKSRSNIQNPLDRLLFYFRN